jgi:hypothetical protein
LLHIYSQTPTQLHSYGVLANAGSLEHCEPITLEFAATENKIVVSDDSEDDDLSSFDDSNTESYYESEVESELSDTHVFEFESNESNNFKDIEVLNINDHEFISELNVSENITELNHTESLIEENVSVTLNENSIIKETATETINENDDLTLFFDGKSSMDNTEHIESQHDQTREVEDVRINNNIEQLKKMNINQLKNIAHQIGIVQDVSKMKKNELIALIRERNSSNV